MADIFMFSAQPEIENEGTTKKPSNPMASTKRARAYDEVGDDMLRRLVGESFKSKLLSHSNQGNWLGFGAAKEKLKIGDYDISFIDGPKGPVMKLSSVLKQQLCKPWSNALILKNTLNFMLSKLRQKWALYGRDVCMKDNIVQNKEAKAPEKDRDSAVDKSEPYGPWMHVSYGRFGRNN
ncbi:hypothetical protein Ddye_003090 [Dipteronia dyeriana]|uniref:Uncharacterized protein n=1 Tax=Dipteronia dyeriana TaxID=168575 RepID=A0AAD9XRH1_9ROSI|nr:hypothetical protein Ddye_003090 [Dipteronia dyeriana]